MEISINITWSSYKPPVSSLRLLAALRRHAATPSPSPARCSPRTDVDTLRVISRNSRLSVSVEDMMARRKYPTPQQVGRAGELFVAAELNRRGALTTLYLTNTPRVDVVATSPDGLRTVHIQVKTKGRGSAMWQWNIKKAEAEQQAPGDDYMVLVDLDPPQASLLCLASQGRGEDPL